MCFNLKLSLPLAWLVSCFGNPFVMFVFLHVTHNIELAPLTLGAPFKDVVHILTWKIMHAMTIKDNTKTQLEKNYMDLTIFFNNEQ